MATQDTLKATTAASTVRDSNPSSADNVAVASIVLVLLIAATIFGNLLVCVAFHLCRDLRTVTNYFVVSLSVADLLVGFVCMPFWFMSLIRNWPHPNSQLYILWMCLDIVSATASITNLAVISVDRFYAITFPFEYHAVLTKRRARLCIVLVWLYALIVSCLRATPFFGKWYTYFVVTASFFVPLPVMIFSYIRIFSVALKQAHKIRLGSCPGLGQEFSEASPASETSAFVKNEKSRPSPYGARKSPSSAERPHISKPRSSQSSMRHMRRVFSAELKAAKTLAIVMGTFILCWAPYIITMLINVSYPDFHINIDISKAIKWLHYSNSAINPIIYTVLNRNFRAAFRKIICRYVSSGKCANLGHLMSRSASRSSRSSVNGVQFSIKLEDQTEALVCTERETVV